MRLRPRSIRARDTLVAAVIAAIVFGITAVGVDFAVRSAVKAEILQQAQVEGRRASGGVRDGTLANPIPDDTNGRVRIQVVEPGGHVTNATPSARGEPPVSRLWPSSNLRVRDYTECHGDRPNRECFVIEAIRATTAPDSVVVYAASPLPAPLVNGLMEALLALAVLMLVGVVAWITWRVVGRTLGPVEAIRAQLAEISATDLSRRVPQPGGEDEIAQLARTANATLDRLERAVGRQRQFASDASHELRTPIAGLRANLEDASMHPEDNDLRAVVESALRDTDRLESIVTDLLLLARLGTGGTSVQERLDLAALAEAETARHPFTRRVTLALGRDVPVRGVRMQLVRLLGNLLDNAEGHADSAVVVAVSREGGAALLTVTDDGPGIAPADRERVFERFTRLDTARSRGAGGTGLGLAIAREIAHAHGGTLRIEDHGPGARFAMRLPLAVDRPDGSPGMREGRPR
ncbi:sensor histidine kinase [Actinomadura livida]|uniref:histidine kinase n=1 Tax=Actinomadura livida TaxID=79909 RepID=A0A7W7IKA9_9ACTN|nr:MULTISPECIES: HAMP domain-containing sensor histidine kinase [Actinomadura]MBB4778682.1 signal transduction histidine kinase [Actinomadura catellatispora]GGU30772.1 two-component sensor histidine kinase [Actinomadura livida]